MAGRYTDEEAKEILRRALERQELANEGFQHEDLVAAAKEVGLDDGAIEQAALELRDEREARSAVQARRRKARRKWFRGLGVYAVINAFLFAIDFLTPGGPWFFWPLLGWGLFVVLRGLRVLPPQSTDAENDEVAAEKARLSRNREKEAKRRARDAARQRGNEAGRVFEESVERGVAALVDAIAHQLEKAGARVDEEVRTRTQTEFDRYVGKQRRRAQGRDERREAREMRRSGGPRARVSADEEAAAAEEEEQLEERADARRRRG